MDAKTLRARCPTTSPSSFAPYVLALRLCVKPDLAKAQRRETRRRKGFEWLGGDSQQAEIAGSLQITFIHHEPDLRLEVPPIPG